MPTYQRDHDLLTERYVKEVFEEMDYKVWWYNDPDQKQKAKPRSRADMAVLDQYPGTPRKLKRPFIPVEVKRRVMTWGQYPDVVLDVDKVMAMRAWTDQQPRVIDNHRIKQDDPNGRYNGLAHTKPAGPAMFVVVPDDLTLRRVWLGPDRLDEWKVTDQPPRPGRNEAPRRVYHIPNSHFTTWYPPDDVKAAYQLSYREPIQG